MKLETPEAAADIAFTKGTFRTCPKNREAANESAEFGCWGEPDKSGIMGTLFSEKALKRVKLMNFQIHYR